VPASAAIKRFFRTPKGLLLVILSGLIALASAGQRVALVAPGLVGAVLVAAALDIVIIRRRQGAWEFPSGAILTGMFVAMILSPQQPWYVAAITSAAAIFSKYVFRTRSANYPTMAPRGLTMAAVRVTSLSHGTAPRTMRATPTHQRVADRCSAQSSTRTVAGSRAVTIVTPRVGGTSDSPRARKRSRVSPSCVTHTTPDKHAISTREPDSTRSDTSRSKAIIAATPSIRMSPSLDILRHPLQT